MISPDLRKTILDVHGAAGEEWLSTFDRELARVADEWGLVLDSPFDNLSYNYVAPGVNSSGWPITLKAGVPSDAYVRESAALHAYGGNGAVRLLRSEPGFLLLERVMPGEMLSATADEESGTRAAASVMRRLWQAEPISDVFPDLRQWTRGIDRAVACLEFVVGALDRAHRLREELLTAPPPPVLLHGDLHHFNILSSDRDTWLSIDPKGVIGEPAFEAVAFLINPALRPVEVLDRRVRILCEELGLDRQRVVAWSVVFGVLSAWWTFEDHGFVGEGALEFGNRMATLLT